jgi:mannose-6-phosphate isomerase-like protein (cupin superfamily)
MDAEREPTCIVDLAALALQSVGGGPAWSHGRQDADLNVNLIVWHAGEGVVEHVNEEVDVLLVGIAGAGIVEVEGREHTLQAGQALIVAKGSRRAIRSTGERFAYLTCHRRGQGLWPKRGARAR